jgi:hypothetical protein
MCEEQNGPRIIASARDSSRCEGKVEASGAANTNRIVHPSKSSLAFRQKKYKWRARFRTELSRHCCPISGYARRRFSPLHAQSGRGEAQNPFLDLGARLASTGAAECAAAHLPDGAPAQL